MHTPIPEPEFYGWLPWSEVKAGNHLAFDEAGTYLLAHFIEGPPSTVDLTEKEIFYVGETHGRTRTLRARLADFGRSAGFSGGPQNGHYAAFRYPELASKSGLESLRGTAHLYIALCPFPRDKFPLAARGVFPGLIEATVLWHYTNAHKRLPFLNNSGANQEKAVRELPTLSTSSIARLFSESTYKGAASDLLLTLAVALGYSPDRRIFAHQRDQWNGVERHLGGGYWLSVGRPDFQPGAVGIRVSHANGVYFGAAEEEAPAATEEGFLALVSRFWMRWHSES